MGGLGGVSGKSFLFLGKEKEGEKREGKGRGEKERLEREKDRTLFCWHLYLDVVSDYLATKRKAKLKDKPLCKDCQSKMIFKNLGFLPTSRFLIMGDKKSSVLFKQAKLELLFLTAGKKTKLN